MKSLHTFSKSVSLVLAVTAAGAAVAEHPGVQPRPGPSTQSVSPDGLTTTVVTPEGHFLPSDPVLNPPGSNFLGDTVYANMRDGNGVEMPNTLPSVAPALVSGQGQDVYNLHDGPVIVSPIDPTSPTDDLVRIIETVKNVRAPMVEKRRAIRQAIDILEGNPVPDRAYSGFPLLHYNGPEKIKRVKPIFDDEGNKISGNVEIHQVWYDNHIESDTALLDPSDVLDVPWTITYVVDMLNRSHDDFAPMVMYTDDPALSPPGMPPMPHVAMDQTFFPMNDGTRNVIKIKMTLGKYYNLTYTWGWRYHPPRVQVSENARKSAAAMVAGQMVKKSLLEWETSVFGEQPTSSVEAKLAALAKIGELSPAKRMWTAFRKASQTGSRKRLEKLMEEAEAALVDWRDRTRLPRGVEVDLDSDFTLFYVNNTIYGEGRDGPGSANGGGAGNLPEWFMRSFEYKVKLLNGDHFEHGYVSVDFGGSRGWENQFQSTIASGGSGCWFTFGRFHWWLNAGGPAGWITVPPAQDAQTPGEHNVHITLNYEPSRRLRMYQFDPLHHDVAVFSLH